MVDQPGGENVGVIDLSFIFGLAACHIENVADRIGKRGLNAVVGVEP